MDRIESLHEMMDVEQSLIRTLGIEFQKIAPDLVICTMPVNEKTVQPFGLLHGGASVALAETAASIGSAMNLDLQTHVPVGIEINANHLRGKRDGIVTATAVPLHKGQSTMVWEIKLTDEEGKYVCVSRCTVAILEKK